MEMEFNGQATWGPQRHRVILRRTRIHFGTLEASFGKVVINPFPLGPPPPPSLSPSGSSTCTRLDSFGE
ncbi:hypothetical protein Q8A67_024316 [Cirrhinus molitorella]|uniref:Uncharacterized protein n=1 Tax=Cirrhinus molitorella TaxID=172907 RepID=A0AA88P4V6_9TELE|nr:hypothetical protein Q8A67_024316 [Cirrhinus molitorella]